MELEELKSLHETFMEKSKYENHLMETRLQESGTTIKQLKEELLAEKSEKEVLIKETTRLRELCDQLDEAKTQTEKDLCVVKEVLNEASEENKQLLKKLSDGVSLISRQEESGVAVRIPNGTPMCLSLIENGVFKLRVKFENITPWLSF